MKRLFAILLVCTLLMSVSTGCGNADITPTASPDVTAPPAEQVTLAPKPENTQAPQASHEVPAAGDMFTNRNINADYNEKKSVVIQLNGTSAQASSNSVKINGSTVTITEEATYIISGRLDDGMIVVNTKDDAKLQIVLKDAHIHSETSAAFYIAEADKVVITLADGTENTLSNGGTFNAIDDSNIDAALFSKQDLSFNGTGQLTVISPVGHGISCKDDLVFTGGSYVIACASHGLDASDSVRIGGSTAFSVTAGKDGIHCENSDDTELGFIYIENGTLSLTAEGDAVAAGAWLRLEGGALNLTAGGGSANGTKASSGNYGGWGGGRPGQSSPGSTVQDDSTSMKGLKAEGDILINGGTITVDSADDSIHSNASVTVNGGTFGLSSGDDGIHAEDTLTVTGCNMVISKSYEGLEAHKIYVQGGEIILNSTDDGLNAAGGTDSSGTAGGRDGRFPGGGGHMGGGSSDGLIDISGGNLVIYASGDGLDANGQLTMSGGYVYVANPTAGDTSVLDSDISPMITGGTFISTGSTTMMAQSFSTQSTQGVIAVTTGSQKAGTTITVADPAGNTVLSYQSEYDYVLIIISSSDLVKGTTYHLTVGTAEGDIQAS